MNITVEELRQRGEYIGSVDATLTPMNKKDWDKEEIKDYILSTSDCGKLPANLAKVYLESYRKGYESAN